MLSCNQILISTAESARWKCSTFSKEFRVFRWEWAAEWEWAEWEWAVDSTMVGTNIDLEFIDLQTFEYYKQFFNSLQFEYLLTNIEIVKGKSQYKNLIAIKNHYTLLNKQIIKQNCFGMDKKKLSAKEIFRILYEQIPVQILADMVSSLYYPINPQGLPKLNYKKILANFMKEYNNQEKTMNQEKFIKFINDMTKFNNEEYMGKLTDRIFNRYCNRQEGVIEQEGFERMSVAFGLKKQQIKDYFLSIADLKNQITKQKFSDFMNGLVMPRRT